MTSHTAISRFAKSLRNEWRRLELPAADAAIVVAVSGGADSVCLLLALHELQQRRKLDLRLIAAHYNHDLRGAESRADAEFVQTLAAQFEFNFVCEVQSPKSKVQSPKFNLEQQLRIERYRFLRETAEKDNAMAVLTAHTLNDQAETFLLRLMRGSGADGLAAMRPTSVLTAKLHEQEQKPRTTKFQISNLKSQILLVRPLLGWARREMTEDYCRAQNVEFRRDAMNDDLEFARVRVRRRLLPLLETFNPKIVQTLAATAERLGEDADALNRAAKRLLKKGIVAPDQLEPTVLKNASPGLRRRALRLWLATRRGDLRRMTNAHLTAVESLIVNQNGNRTIELPGGGTVVRSGGKIVFNSSVDKSFSRPYNQNGDENDCIPVE